MALAMGRKKARTARGHPEGNPGVSPGDWTVFISMRIEPGYGANGESKWACIFRAAPIKKLLAQFPFAYRFRGDTANPFSRENGESESGCLPKRSAGVPLPMAPGQVRILQPLVAHASGPKLSGEDRIAMMVGYQKPKKAYTEIEIKWGYQVVRNGRKVWEKSEIPGHDERIDRTRTRGRMPRRTPHAPNS